MVVPYGEGVPLPQDKPRPYWKVITPWDHYPYVVTFLGESFVGFMLHFIPELHKNLPCPGEASCYVCRKMGLRPRWMGYAPVLSGRHKGERIIALTEGAGRQLLPRLADRKTLRGLTVRLQRRPPEGARPKPNDPVIVTFVGEMRADSIPPAFDVLESLEKMWGVNRAFLASVSPDFAQLRPDRGDVA